MSPHKVAGINIATVLLQALIGTCVIPVYVSNYGRENFGSIAFIWLLVSAFSLADLGYSKTTTIDVSKASTVTEQGNIIKMGLKTVVALGVIFQSASLVFLLLTKIVFGVKIEKITGFSLFELLGISAILPAHLATNLLIAALDGLGRFSLSNTCQISGYLAFQLVPLALGVFVDPSLAVAVVGMVAAKIIALIVAFLCVFKAGYSVRMLLLKPDKKISLRISERAKWIGVNSIIGYMVETLDKHAIMLLAGANEFSLYFIPFNLISKVRAFPDAISRGVLPFFAAKSIAPNSFSVVHLSASLTNAVAFILCAFLVVGRIVYTRWLGQAYQFKMLEVSYIISFGIVVGSAASCTSVAIEASGRSKELFKIYKMTLPFYGLGLILLVWKFGVIGAAIAWSLRITVDSLFLMSITIGLRGVLKIAKSSVIFFVAYPLLYFLNVENIIPTGWRILIFFLFLVLCFWEVLVVYRILKRQLDFDKNFEFKILK